MRSEGSAERGVKEVRSAECGARSGRREVRRGRRRGMRVLREMRSGVRITTSE